MIEAKLIHIQGQVKKHNSKVSQRLKVNLLNKDSSSAAVLGVTKF